MLWFHHSPSHASCKEDDGTDKKNKSAFGAATPCAAAAPWERPVARWSAVERGLDHTPQDGGGSVCRPYKGKGGAAGETLLLRRFGRRRHFFHCLKEWADDAFRMEPISDGQ